MARLKIEDLAKIRDQARRAMNLREGAARAKVTMHMGTCGIASGARDVMAALLDEVEKQGAKDVIITTSGCAGLCSREPMATVELENEAPVKYVDLTADKIRRVFKEHVLGGKMVTEYVLAVGSETTHMA
jgi:NADP-reducing hydrogenase subunit HndB